MEADFDIEYQLYIEEKEVAASDPNYCATCINWRVIIDRIGDSSPCPDCTKPTQSA